jgi:hypothetical protein
LQQRQHFVRVKTTPTRAKESSSVTPEQHILEPERRRHHQVDLEQHRHRASPLQQNQHAKSLRARAESLPLLQSIAEVLNSIQTREIPAKRTRAAPTPERPAVQNKRSFITQCLMRSTLQKQEAPCRLTGTLCRATSEQHPKSN